MCLNENKYLTIYCDCILTVPSRHVSVSHLSRHDNQDIPSVMDTRLFLTALCQMAVPVAWRSGLTGLIWWELQGC